MNHCHEKSIQKFACEKSKHRNYLHQKARYNRHYVTKDINFFPSVLNQTTSIKGSHCFAKLGGKVDHGIVSPRLICSPTELRCKDARSLVVASSCPGNTDAIYSHCHYVEHNEPLVYFILGNQNIFPLWHRKIYLNVSILLFLNF